MEGWNNGQFPKKQHKQAYVPTNSKSPDQEKSLPKDLEDQIMIRSKQGISMYSIADDYTYFVTNDNVQSIFTKDGTKLVCVGTNVLSLYDCNKNSMINAIYFDQIMIAGLSSADQYITLVEKKNKDLYHLNVLSMKSLETIYEFQYKFFRREAWPLIKFDQHDELAYRISAKHELEVYQMTQRKFLTAYNLEHPVDSFSLSPDAKNQHIICLLAEHQIGFNRSQAYLSILKLDCQSLKLIFQKEMEKAQEMSANWSPDGQCALIQTSTLHDETGNSYYGLNQLLCFDTQKEPALKQIFCPQGPIHDVAWSPNNENFIVISGFMPATAVMYKKDCTPFYEFGKNHRNTIKFSPFSRFVMLGGFGNLSGDIDFWDLTQMKVVGTVKSAAAMSYIWSPDGRQLLTGTLHPRLRIDNNFKIFYYSGISTLFKDFSDTELYEVQWRPSLNTYKDRPTSRENSVQKKTEDETQKPRKILNLQMSSFAKEMIKTEKKQSMGRYLNAGETFQNVVIDDKIEDKNIEDDKTAKKKRIRHKKPKNNDTSNSKIEQD